jgi:hypothetical protein
MKRYYIALAILMIVMLAAGVVVKMTAASHFHLFMPLLAVYFAVVAGVQHYIVVKSMQKSPRQFVQYFMGATVATLLLHLVVFAAYLFTHPQQAKVFAITFSIGFAAMLIFETVALVIFINRQRKNSQQ